mgnify:CR=1 FL=1
MPFAASVDKPTPALLHAQPNTLKHRSPHSHPLTRNSVKSDACEYLRKCPPGAVVLLDRWQDRLGDNPNRRPSFVCSHAPVGQIPAMFMPGFGRASLSPQMTKGRSRIASVGTTARDNILAAPQRSCTQARGDDGQRETGTDGTDRTDESVSSSTRAREGEMVFIRPIRPICPPGPLPHSSVLAIEDP